MVLDAQSLETCLKILILSDKKPGHLNQSIAFAKLKGLEYDILDISITPFKKSLSYLLDNLNIYLNIANIKLPNTKYNAVVSTGSSTYYTNKYIAKKLSISSVAIMLPKGFRLDNFDYILALEHDNPPKLSNIIPLPISLSASEPKGYIKKESKPSLGIIIGGNNSIFTMDKKSIKKELDTIFKNYPNHLKYITTSRRTPKEIEELLEEYQFDYKLIYSKEPSINPIPDFLEVCDELFITIDSTSMLSEAKANSNAKLHIINLSSQKKDTKFHRLARNIEKLEGRFDFMPYLKKINLPIT